MTSKQKGLINCFKSMFNRMIVRSVLNVHSLFSKMEDAIKLHVDNVRFIYVGVV